MRSAAITLSANTTASGRAKAARDSSRFLYAICLHHLSSYCPMVASAFLSRETAGWPRYFGTFSWIALLPLCCSISSPESKLES